MKNTLHLTLANDLSEIQRLRTTFEQFAVPFNIPDKVMFHVNLALEEIIANIIHYGYDDREQEITVNIVIDDYDIRIKIIDNGVPFNPIETAAPDLDRPIEDRPIGGLGVHLVKSIMDSMTYRRIKDANHLILTKRIIEK